MEITADFTILVPIVIGVVQVVKMVGLPARFTALTALLLGVAGAYVLIGGDVRDVVTQGLVAGLTASGLWSATRSTLKI